MGEVRAPCVACRRTLLLDSASHMCAECLNTSLPCTPRCKPGTVHALDCAYYSGPLSRTGSLSHADPREVAIEGDW